MGHVERGEKNVSLSTVARVANALGVRISALFGRSRESAMEQSTPVRPPTAGRAGSIWQHQDVICLLDELQAQRKAMRLALRDLSSFLVRLTDSVS
jgi:hypothetical protein